MSAPKGKHMFGLVKVGERGQIVIPKKARDLFGIKPGDSMMVLGNEELPFPGVALIKNDLFVEIIEKVLSTSTVSSEEKEFVRDILAAQRMGSGDMDA